MKTLLLFLGFLYTSLFCLANDYYVSPSGSNLNNGSSGTPWQTLQYSVDQLQPGDALYILAGTYNEKINITVSGTVNNPIEIVGQSGAILDGTGLTNQTAMINVADQSYIQISSLTIQNNIMNDAQGIAVSGYCVGLWIAFNHLSNIHFSNNPNDPADETTNAQPIIVLGTDSVQAISDLVVMSNTIEDCRLGYSEALAVNGNVRDFTISKNTIRNVTNIGIAVIGHEGTSSDPLTDQARFGTVSENKLYNCRSPYAACAGIYVDGGRNILIERNSSHENNYGIEIGCEHPNKWASDVLIRNNIVYYNDYTGILAGGYDHLGLSGAVERVDIYNNTLFRNDSLYDGNGDMLFSYLLQGHVENNIFFTNEQGKAIVISDTIAGVTIDYNLYYNTAHDPSELFEDLDGVYDLTGFQQQGFDEHSLFADPLFGIALGQTVVDDDYFSMGFNLESPAVDHGNPSSSISECGQQDFYSAYRFWDMIIDIGASELWYEGLSEVEKDPMVLYPNPSTETLFLKDGDFENYVIYDLQGNQVGLGKIDNATIPVATLENGSYLIRLTNGQESILNRFTKCH